MVLSSLKAEILALHAQLHSTGMEPKPALEAAIHEAMANLSLSSPNDSNEHLQKTIADLLADFDETDPETKAMSELMADPEKFSQWIDRDFGADEDQAASRVDGMLAGGSTQTPMGSGEGGGAVEYAGAVGELSRPIEGRPCLHLADEFPWYDCANRRCGHDCCLTSWEFRRASYRDPDVMGEEYDAASLTGILAETVGTGVTSPPRQDNHFPTSSGIASWDAEGDLTFQDPEFDADGKAVGIQETNLTAAEAESMIRHVMTAEEIEEAMMVE